MRIKKFLRKAAEDLVTAYRKMVAHVFPKHCIWKKIVKSNPDAWDFMPSLKRQLKAIETMTAEELQDRCWSADALKVIFHKKNIFFKKFNQMEFYNLLTDKSSVIGALEAGVSFTSEQENTIVNNIGLYSLVTCGGRCKAFARNWVRYNLTNNKCAAAVLRSIAASNDDEIYHLYLTWLQQYAGTPKNMDIAYLTQMVNYLFDIEVFIDEKYVEANLKDAYLCSYSSDYNAKCVWLSFLYHKLTEREAYTLAYKNRKNIMAYLEGNPAWKQEFIDAFILASSDYSVIKEFYDMSSDKEKHIFNLCRSARNLDEIKCCLDLIENMDTIKMNLGPTLIAKAMNCMSTWNDRCYVSSETVASYLLDFMKKEAYWNHSQRKAVLKAVAVGGYMPEEMFNSLSEDEKEMVEYEMELFSQFSLISTSSDAILTQKIRLFPEAEAVLAKRMEGTILKSYIDIYSLSNEGYRAMVQNSFLPCSLILQHAKNHGVTKWQYMEVMKRDNRRFLAPQIKCYMKQ
jgi:hypothetical protein